MRSKGKGKQRGQVGGKGKRKEKGKGKRGREGKGKGKEKKKGKEEGKRIGKVRGKSKGKRKGNAATKATEAAEKDNLFALQQIAMDLGIELPPPTEEQLEIFEKEAGGVRKQTGDMEKTFAWNWHNAKSEEERQAIMAQYINIMVERAVKKP